MPHHSASPQSFLPRISRRPNRQLDDLHSWRLSGTAFHVSSLPSTVCLHLSRWHPMTIWPSVSLQPRLQCTPQHFWCCPFHSIYGTVHPRALMRLLSAPYLRNQSLRTNPPPTQRHYYIGYIGIACTRFVSTPDPYMSFPVDSKDSPASGASGKGLVTSIKGAFRGARNRIRNALDDDNQTAGRGACLSAYWHY